MIHIIFFYCVISKSLIGNVQKVNKSINKFYQRKMIGCDSICFDTPNL